MAYADIDWESILASPLFEFIVGQNEKRFNIHSALVSHYSGPLDLMINGSMKEATEGYARLNKVDDQTFIRFCQFAYTADYNAAVPEITSSIGEDTQEQMTPFETHSAQEDHGSGPLTEEPVAEEPVAEDLVMEEQLVDEWDTFGSRPRRHTSKKNVKKAPQIIPQEQKMWTDFCNRVYVSSKTQTIQQENENPNEEFTIVFLSHARVYVFADTYDVLKMRNLALQKLKDSLEYFRLHQERYGDVTELISHVYNNTTERNDGRDDLRNMVTRYAAIVVERLCDDESFRRLLRACDPFAGNLMIESLGRLV